MIDHCTGWFDRLLWLDWSACCASHDRDYSIGIVKDLADGFLAICVNAELPGMGTVMWWGLVIVFGWLSKIYYERARREREARQSSEHRRCPKMLILDVKAGR